MSNLMKAMRWLTTGPKEMPVPSEIVLAPKQPELSIWEKANEAARLMEPDVLAQIDQLHDEFEAEYLKDQKDYRIRINRIQNWLQVFIQRGDETFSTALNLNRIDALQLYPGHLPDKQGRVEYAYIYEPKPFDPTETIPGNKGWGSYSGNGTYVLMPELPKLPIRKLFVGALEQQYDYEMEAIQRRLNINAYRDRPQNPDYETKNFPRPAFDDRIEFQGLKSVLHAPFGMGERIYNRILRARDSFGRA